MTDVKAYWNSRASLGAEAGTQDRILKQLEMAAIAKYVQDGMRILDVGCGTGETGAYLLERFSLITWRGIDYAEEMVVAARSRLAGSPRAAVWQNSIIGSKPRMANFDLIYSERCLINLPDWKSQKQAIKNIISLLKPGGKYLMVESCQEALDGLNDLRAVVSLPAIQPPWHNRYLQLRKLNTLRYSMEEANWTYTDNFAGTYYLLSRVLNAALAMREELEPDYDAPINKLALELPAEITSKWGQTVMFIWEKDK